MLRSNSPKTVLRSSNITFGTSKRCHQFSPLFSNHPTKKPLHFPTLTKMIPIPMPPKMATNRAIQTSQESAVVVQKPVDSSALEVPQSTLGRYLARRLVQIGVTDVFAVPGDSNLTLLDHLITEPGLQLIGCCNELNAGYAADGYARSRGVGACVFTFTVGGLSAINAIAGAYSENLPLICVVGGPNSHYYDSDAILHHTLGMADFSQELRCFENVTCYQAVVNKLEGADELIDKSIATALSQSKPVYITISCDLPDIPHPSFNCMPVPFFTHPRKSNPVSLQEAVEAAAEMLNKATNPVLIGGPDLRPAKARRAFIDLANDSGYATAVVPAAKGLVPENHPQYIGSYWGTTASNPPQCAEIIESADAFLYVGAIFYDLSTTRYSTIFKKEAAIVVQPERVVIGNDAAFECVLMREFLEVLAKRLKHNNTSMTTLVEGHRLVSVPEELLRRPNEALKANLLFRHLQKMLATDSVVIADAGDAWFISQKLNLPHGCGYSFTTNIGTTACGHCSGYETQMLYASIGWSVGATLGYAQAAPKKRVIACIGDGSFQMGAQEVSTMIRCGQRSIIFLLNNGGYAVEERIHEGPYNVIKNWDYTGLVHAIHNRQGKCWSTQVRYEGELIAAIEMAMVDKKDCLCFIEVILQKNDTTEELIDWVTRLTTSV